jgi:hypothetical protein
MSNKQFYQVFLSVFFRKSISFDFYFPQSFPVVVEAIVKDSGFFTVNIEIYESKIFDRLQCSGLFCFLSWYPSPGNRLAVLFHAWSLK